MNGLVTMLISSNLKSYSSQIFEYAILSELLQRNPMQNVKLPKLQKEESLKHVLIFQLLIATGVRKGELTAIRWSDIDFEEKLLNVGKSYVTIKK